MNKSIEACDIKDSLYSKIFFSESYKNYHGKICLFTPLLDLL